MVNCSAGPRNACRRTIHCSAGPVHAGSTVDTSTVESSSGPRVSSPRPKIPRRTTRAVESAVHYGRAASDERRAIKDHRTTAPSRPPSASPVAPSPAPVRKDADTNPESKADRQSTPENPRRRIVVEAGIRWERRSIDRPGVIHRNVDHRRIGWRNRNRAAIGGHHLLRRAAQLTCGLCLLAHRLHCIHHVLWLIVVGIAQVGRPLNVLVQLREHGRKRRKRLHARVPVLVFRTGSNLFRGGAALCLPPAICLHHLSRISCGCKNLRQQRVGIERDWRYQLVQLLSRQGLSLRYWLTVIRYRWTGRCGIWRHWHGLRKRVTLHHRNHDHQRAKHDCQPLPSQLSDSLSSSSGVLTRLKNAVQHLFQPSGFSCTYVEFHKSHSSNACTFPTR